MFDFFAQALLPYYIHLIATTLFCKIIFYVQHFLSMLDFIFFCSYNGFCDNTKTSIRGNYLKKRRRCGKEGKNGLVYRKLSGRNDAYP